MIHYKVKDSKLLAKCTKQIFIILLISSLIKPLYDYPAFLFSVNIILIHHIISVLMISFGIISIILNGKLINNFPLQLVFVLGLFLGLIRSEYNNISIIIYFSHCYYFIMPIVSLHIGRVLWDYYNIKIIKTINKISVRILPLLVIGSLGYFLLHFGYGYWEYFGYTSGLLFAYLLSSKGGEKKINWYYFFIDLFSGKRSSILLWFVAAFGRSVFTAFILLIFTATFIYTNQEIIPERYMVVFDFDFSDEIIMSLATGGRSNEWLSIIDRLNNSFINWLFGVGFGAPYQVYDPILKIFEYRHYAHMTPLTYTYISGALIAVILYLLLSLNSVKILKCGHSGLAWYFIVYFLLSPLGGSLLVEPLPWIIFGICYRINFLSRQKLISKVH
jgi:hypothetical protein